MAKRPEAKLPDALSEKKQRLQASAFFSLSKKSFQDFFDRFNRRAF